MKKVFLLLTILCLFSATENTFSKSKKSRKGRTKYKRRAKTKKTKKANILTENCQAQAPGKAGTGITLLTQMRKHCAEKMWLCLEKKINTRPNSKLFKGKEKLKTALFETAFADQMAPRLETSIPGIKYDLITIKKEESYKVNCGSSLSALLKYIRSKKKE